MTKESTDFITTLQGIDPIDAKAAKEAERRRKKMNGGDLNAVCELLKKERLTTRKKESIGDGD